MRLLLICGLTVLMSGCLMNSAYRLRGKRPLGSNQSVVVFGVRLDAEWSRPQFEITLDEYSVQHHGITGNCFRYTRLQSRMSAHPSGTVYFAYLVPAAAYIYSFGNPVRNGSAFDGERPTVFVAAPGTVVYFGDFVYDGARMTLQGDLKSAQDAVKPLLSVHQTLTQSATLKDAIKTRAFLCTP